jgi:CDP-diacylglycerol--glycerol-3-phosphate 3-phosphatidyltransferase
VTGRDGVSGRDGVTGRDGAAAPHAAGQDRIFTVPNALSALRLIGVPVFLYLLLVSEADGWAFALLVLSGVTDWLDGKIARLLDQSSRLGAMLDPLVDRIYVVTTLIGFVIRGIIPWWVAVLIIGRDAILTLTLVVYRRRGLAPPDVIYLGKAATFALMFALPLLLAGEINWAGAAFASASGSALLVWGTALYVWTGILYVGKAVAVARVIPVPPGRGSSRR